MLSQFAAQDFSIDHCSVSGSILNHQRAIAVEVDAKVSVADAFGSIDIDHDVVVYRAAAKTEAHDRVDGVRGEAKGQFVDLVRLTVLGWIDDECLLLLQVCVGFLVGCVAHECIILENMLWPFTGGAQDNLKGCG